MSFRDTFTRNQSSSQNLQYDDTAAYHFLTTILLLIVLPLTYSIIKAFLNPFAYIPKLKEVQNKPQFVKKISKFKKQNRYKFITCWFIIKIFLMFAMIFALVHCILVLRQKGDNMKGFDPYEILQVQTDAPIEKIKKSYRKLALKYHPDRNQDDPQANARFIMISKAYQCLTDEKAKQNCLKFGNPEGSSSFNVGIALPSFLVKKQNQVVIMGVVFVIVVIVLPLFLIYYFGQVNKYDQYGMLQESHPFVNGMINQQLSIKDCVKCLSVCAQFKHLKISKQQIDKLEVLLKQSSQDYTKVFLKKNFPNFIKKTIVLIDARINEKKVPQELLQDHKFIMKKIPILIKSIIMMGLERSNQMIARYRPQLFVGANAISSLIMFSQYFIQGKSLESQPFEQLDFTEEQLDKIYKKKKKRSLNLPELYRNQEDKGFILSNLTPQRSRYIEDMLTFIPRIESLEVIVHAAGDKDITTMDNIEVILNFKSNRKSSFCNAAKYPFLKMQGWWVMVTDKNYIIHLQQFTFENSQQFEVKFYRGMYRQAGNYSLTIKVFSDCYFGLDVQRVEKFTVKQAKKIQNQTVEKDDLDQDQSLFSRWMKSVMPQEQQELSDREDQNGKKQKLKKEKKKQEQQKNEERTVNQQTISRNKIQLQEKNQ